MMVAKRAFQLLAACVLFSLHLTAIAAVTFVDLGTSAPPASVGGNTMQVFSTSDQAAIANFTNVTTIPGNPLPGSLTVSTAVNKRTVPSGGWSSWSHGYAGPVFFANAATTLTLTLPAGAQAFYFYAEPSNFGLFNIQATTDSGATSGPISVNGSAGANGFGFYASAGETITSITITAPAGAGGFSLGEFGIATAPVAPPPPAAVPTLSEWATILLTSLMALGTLMVMRRRH